MRNSKVLLLCLFLIGNLYHGFSQYRRTATGLKFAIHHNENGKTAKKGDFVSMHMIMSHPQAGELKNTYKEGKPILFPVKSFNAFDGDLTEGLKLLSKGDSASFVILADSMFALVFKKPMPQKISKGSFLNFTVKVLDVKSAKTYENELKAKNEEYKKLHASEIAKRHKKEDLVIQNYISTQGFDYKKTTSGAYYTIVTAGQGRKVKKGDAIVFHYIGSLIDDETEFESTYTLGQPSAFTLGNGDVIQGWEEVFSQLTEGDECKMVIPSHLAFGRKENKKVPSNSVLVFDVKIITVK